MPATPVQAADQTINTAAAGTPFNPGVRGMNAPALNTSRPEYTVGITKTLAVSKGTSIRGWAGGLEADFFNWETRNDDARPSSLEYQRYARDNQSEMIFTTNIRGLVGPDPQNPGQRKYTDTSIATLSQLAGEWVRYTNGITQTYRQGDAVSASDQAILNKLVWNTGPTDNWSKLLSPAEGAVPKVKYWEIGNEPTISTGVYGITNPVVFNNSPSSVADYRDRYAALTSAMRAQDSTIKVGPCFVGFPGFENGLINGILGDQTLPVDFISYHPYYPVQSLGNQTTVSGRENGLNGIYAHQQSYVDNLKNLITQNGRNPANIELMASEINASYFSTNDQPPEANMAHALGSIETVFSLARLGVRAGHYWVFPAHRQDGTEYPVFRAYEGLQDHMGDTMLATYTAGLARVYTTRDSATGEIAIWGLNFDNDDDAVINLALNNLTGGEQVTLMTLGAISGDTNLDTSNLSPSMSGGPTNLIDWTSTDLTGQINFNNFNFVLPDATISVLVIQPVPEPALGGVLFAGATMLLATRRSRSRM